MAKVLTEPKVIKAKKRCCKDRPRCKSCPVVCKRLVLEGHAEQLDKRLFVVLAGTPKSAVKAARARPKG